MKDKFHHRGHREGLNESCGTSLRAPCLSGKYLLATVVSIILIASALARTHTRPAETPTQRSHYQIKLALDFANRSYTGTEVVRFVNRGERPINTLFFHLYPNIRVPGYAPPAPQNKTEPQVSDEPRLQILEVHSANSDAPLLFDLDDLETTLRIALRELVMPKAAVEIEIKFKGSVPEIDSEETGIATHVVQQVTAAIRNTRELRRARDTNFRCRGIMMLGTSYPILAARDGDDWLRKIDLSVGSPVTSDAADYNVNVEAPHDVQVFTPVLSGVVSSRQETNSTEFTAEHLRGFAIVAGRNLHAEQRAIGNLTLRSIFRPEHETVARRVLDIAAEAAQVYERRFGALPLNTVTIVDAPLVATLGSAEFSGLSAIASAFYLDFESPTMRNMPEVIREQRASVEDSLEWTVAHVIAHGWWGAAVGNDPGRDPVLDEALANWSALLYYREVHGETQAALALDEQLRGVYRLYRTFGGEDMEASHAAHEYRNGFQYSAIVTSKGALMFEALRKLVGDEKYFAALRNYYDANLLELADMDDLRGAFIAAASLEQRRAVTRTFDRWLSSKRGDEDIGPPDPKLAADLADLGLPLKTANAKNDKSVISAFGKVGKFFWQQMIRIR
jgi:Peptidase family M1 domain